VVQEGGRKRFAKPGKDREGEKTWKGKGGDVSSHLGFFRHDQCQAWVYSSSWEVKSFHQYKNERSAATKKRKERRDECFSSVRWLKITDQQNYILRACPRDEQVKKNSFQKNGKTHRLAEPRDVNEEDQQQPPAPVE